MSLTVGLHEPSDELLNLEEQLILYENTFKVCIFCDKKPKFVNLRPCFAQVARKERNRLQQLFKTIVSHSQLSEESIFLSLQAANRLLSVYPYLIDTFLLSIRGSTLELVLRECQVQHPQRGCIFSKISVIRTVRRLLCLSPSRLLEIWDWSPLVTLFSDTSLEVRVEAVHAVGLILSLSEHDINSMISLLRQDVIENIDGSKLVDDESESDLERAKLFISGLADSSDLPSSSTASNDVNISRAQSESARDSNSISKNIESLFITEVVNRSCSADKEFVHTMTTCKNLENMAVALCQKRPILVEGPSGSGKTALIEYVATLTGNSNSMIRVHLDDQMDSKTLVGSYVCTETPGEFVWQAGALTQAMEQVRPCHSPSRGRSPPHITPPVVLLSRRGERWATGSSATARARPRVWSWQGRLARCGAGW
jgi:hypothetical protein